MKDPKSSLQAALIQSVAEAMEVMAFVRVEPISENGDGDSLASPEASGTDPNPGGESADPPLPALLENPYWAKLKLVAPLKGEIAIETSAAYARNVTMALCDADGEVESDEAIRDSLAEILNTIAGRVMAKLTPPDAEYEIGLPETGVGSYSADKAAVVQRFDASGQELKIIMLVRNLKQLGK